MTSAARHNELVDFILAWDRDLGFAELEKQFVAKFPEVTFADLDKAMIDAADRQREQSAVLNAQADELERFMPVFEGSDKSRLLIDIARKKAATGDALAAEFLKWCEE